MKSPSLLTLALLLLTTGVLSTPLPGPALHTVDNDYYPQPHTGWGGGDQAETAEEKRDATTVDNDYYPQAHTGWGGGSKAVETETGKRDDNTLDVHYYPQAHTGWGSWGKKAEAGAE